MNRLEEKIIKKVYKFETKKTSFQIIFALGRIVFIAVIFGLLSISLFADLQKIRLSDYLQIFNEDYDVIKMYIWDVLEQVYQEIPKAKVFFTLLSFITFLLLTVIFFVMLTKMKKKIAAIKKYWFSKKLL